MKKEQILTLLCAIVLIGISFGINAYTDKGCDNKVVKVGFIHVGDGSTAYTANFLKAQNEIEAKFGDRVSSVALYNIAEGNEDAALEELVQSGCDIIFATSYGYGETTKEFAKKYPNIQFCQSTCANANEGEKVENYHTFMGAIHEGRFVSGAVAGMKIKELINSGKLKPEDAKIGYVGAYPYAEVISGYTAFFLGVKSVVPEATMTVKYTNTWSNYVIEKRIARELIEEGCVVISQHSDTEGPAVACEEAISEKKVFHVGYNVSMIDVAPTSSLISTRINWEPYMVSAVEAVLKDKPIENVVKGHRVGNDMGAGFKDNWVEVIGLNDVIAAKGSKDYIETAIKDLKNENIDIFKGDFIGVDPMDSSDTIDLREGYEECDKGSAPSFHYILKDAITIKE